MNSPGLDGIFRLQNVPAGRHTIRFSYFGYETHYEHNLLVTSAREMVLTVIQYESVIEMEEMI